MQALYRGEPCDTSLSVAWSNSGELQIELISSSTTRQASLPSSSTPVAPAFTSWLTGQPISRRR